LNRRPERVTTRQKLIDLYIANGQDDEAQKQRDILKMVQERLQAIQQSQKGAVTSENKPTESGSAQTPSENPEASQSKEPDVPTTKEPVESAK
jgi:hypothetical protein